MFVAQEPGFYDLDVRSGSGAEFRADDIEHQRRHLNRDDSGAVWCRGECELTGHGSEVDECRTLAQPM